MLEFAEEDFGRGDNFDSGDVADHGGEVMDSGTVIDGNEEDFSGRGLGKKNCAEGGGEKGDGDLHFDGGKVPGFVKYQL